MPAAGLDLTDALHQAECLVAPNELRSYIIHRGGTRFFHRANDCYALVAGRRHGLRLAHACQCPAIPPGELFDGSQMPALGYLNFLSANGSGPAIKKKRRADPVRNGNARRKVTRSWAVDFIWFEVTSMPMLRATERCSRIADQRFDALCVAFAVAFMHPWLRASSREYP